MPKVNYVDAEGAARAIDVPVGMSIADGAILGGVPGIEADCGGCCACATCHVYVDDAWLGRIPQIEELEEHMLDHAIDRRANSRLSCQLRLTDALDGIVVHTPERQYL